MDDAESVSAPLSARRLSSLITGLVRPIVYGSYAQLTKKSDKVPAGHTHKWKVFIQGYENKDISHWCSHVVFKLHNSFTEPRRVVRVAPFEVNETGWGEFEVAIELHFKDPRMRPVTVFHHLKLWPVDATPENILEWTNGAELKPVIFEKYDELVFTSPLTHIMKEAFDDYDQLVDPPKSFSVESKFNSEMALKYEAELDEFKKLLESQIEELAKSKEQSGKVLGQLRKYVNELKSKRGIIKPSSRSNSIESFPMQSPTIVED